MNEYHTRIKKLTEQGWKTVSTIGDTIYEGAMKTFKECVLPYASKGYAQDEPISITMSEGKKVIATFSIR